ncbi:MAG: MBOAT family protein [Planctomycetes bacterium]|nr:MBOAT family protein [Planctomycetota bacterium]
MLFVEPRFFCFFAAVFLIHWVISHATLRKVWLLLVSYLFYAAWDWRFLGLILASTVIDYSVGVMLSRPLSRAGRKGWLIFSVASNLGILGFFKYYNFFIESAADVSALMGLSMPISTLNIILPVGISFYTFQTLSYSIDVYRGRLEPTKNFLDLALFVGFFPQLVAGPIVRAKDFLPQLRLPRVFARVEIRACLTLFLIGYFKKACISDNIAPIVDAYFAAPGDFSALSGWIAVSFYAVQIYCDFSGYSDMAIACAGLLGYRLCVNFHFPYFAANVSEFWGRWHISLSSWLKDYLYVPLGGNRGSKLFTYRNLMLTMLLGGLWHGAAWNFVIWGALHGFALIAHKEWRRLTGSQPKPSTPTRVLTTLLTFYWVCLAWIFFRSPDLATSATIAKAFVLLQSEGSAHLGLDHVWLLPCLAAAHWAMYKGRFLDRLARMADWAFAAWYSLATSLVIALLPATYRAFIYFQF